jgi:8-oxo-dGTP pyrophosphatase MutT (NUDIX family)
VTVGGHYAAGEDAAKAGPREIREEIGLEVPFSDLVPVGRRVFVYCFTPDVTEFELQDVFLLRRSAGTSDLLIQPEELEGIMMLDIEEGIKLFSGTIPYVETVLFGIDRLGHDVEVRAGDFVPCMDDYYLKMLLLGRRYLRGERELLRI